MGQRGRKPKPSAIRLLEGNAGKRPINLREPKPEKKAPPCPKWLDPEAKKEWRRLSKKLEQLGILTEADMSVFASYCQAYARWKAAEEIIHDFQMRITWSVVDEDRYLSQMEYWLLGMAREKNDLP